jgi:hypothetical protein
MLAVHVVCGAHHRELYKDESCCATWVPWPILSTTQSLNWVFGWIHKKEKRTPVWLRLGINFPLYFVVAVRGEETSVGV